MRQNTNRRRSCEHRLEIMKADIHDDGSMDEEYECIRGCGYSFVQHVKNDDAE